MCDIKLFNGMDVKMLLATIGHVSAATTLDIYSHVTDTMQMQAAVNIDRHIGKTDAQMPEVKQTPTATQNTPVNALCEHTEANREPIPIYDFNYTKQLDRKTLQLIKTFLDIYPKFLPVFNTLKIKEYESLGISTLTFEDIKTFYQDSYELILYSLPRVVARNNIYERKDINNFVNKTEDFKDKINSYKSKVNIYRDLVLKHDKFSWLINSAIENHVRNSIGHFNYEENLEERTILFIDDHQGKIKMETKTLKEIARECVHMFYTLVNLLELNYNIIKIQTI